MNVLVKMVKGLVLAAAFGGVLSVAAGVNVLNGNGEFKKTITVAANEEVCIWIDHLDPNMMYWGVEIEGKNADGDIIWNSNNHEVCTEDGTTTAIYAFFSKDDWGMADGMSGSYTFTVRVSGEADAPFTLNRGGRSDYKGSLWEDDDDPVGPVNPPVVSDPPGATEGKAVTVAVKSLKHPEELNDRGVKADRLLTAYGSVFFLKMTLTAGQKYYFGYAGDGVAARLYRENESATDLFATARSYADVWTDCTRAIEFVPSAGGTYYVLLSGSPAQPFSFFHGVIPPRKIGDHDATALAVGKTSDVFLPGRLCNPAYGGYDGIIDDKLFKVTGFEKNANYVFSTEGADKPLLMVFYDATGAEKARNRYVAEGLNDVRIGWTAPANAKATDVYYIGVCQQLEEGEEPSAGPVALKVEKVDLEDEAAPLDLALSPGTAVASEPRLLDSTHWFNTYTIAGRADITYTVRLETSQLNGLALAARAYQLSGKTQAAVATSGSLDRGLEISVKKNGIVYLEVSVADNADKWGSGKSLDCGPYTLIAYADGNYGALKVDLSGAPEGAMQWMLTKKDKTALKGEANSPSGATAILSAGDYYFKAVNVTDFNNPVEVGPFSVKAGAVTSAEYLYTDKSDPGDDQFSGSGMVDGKKVTYKPVALKPSAKGETKSRSLLTNDVADCYSFTAVAGTYYKFAFSEKAGDPVLAVFDKAMQKCPYVILTDVEEAVQICAAEKGTYYVKVSHGNDGAHRVNCSYTLVSTSANPGQVKFAKTAVSVKDNAGYADLSVSRTGKDGVVRVKYRTVGDQDDKENAYYYPTHGELRWENGDQKAKTIRVRLLPFDGWQENKSVKVVLEPVSPEDADFDAASEYVASFPVDAKTKETLDTATITVAYNGKKTPGTVQVADQENAKKPVVSFRADVTGGTNRTYAIAFERVKGASGANGRVVVNVTATAKSPCVAGRDYEFVSTNLTWENGETTVKTVPVTIMPSVDATTATKTFTIKLTLDKASEKATMAAASFGVTIRNGNMEDPDPRTLEKDKSVTVVGPWKYVYTLKGGDEVTVAPEAGKSTTVKIKKGSVIESEEMIAPKGAEILHTGVWFERNLGTDAASKAKKGKLPDGLKLAQDKSTKEWTLSGVPTKAGCFYAEVGECEPLMFEVRALSSAVGTFTGLATTTDTADGLRSLARVTVTANEKGSITAKAEIGGKSYSFSTKTGFTDYTEGDGTNVPAVVTVELPLELKNITFEGVKQTVTNWCYVTLADLDETDPAAWTQQGRVQLMLTALEDPTVKTKTYDPDVWYEGKLCRDNSKVADWVAKMAAYTGYYTVALANPDASWGEPQGNGYLTLTMDAKGKAKLAGMLADGTKYSGTAAAAYLVSDGVDEYLRVPVYLCKSPYVFGGWLEFVQRDVEGVGQVPVVTAVTEDASIVWKNDAVTATRWSDSGFALNLYPVGGWYDTVGNLQRWYVDYAFAADVPNAEDMFEELAETLPEGYQFVAEANPVGTTVTVNDNSLAVDKQVLVKDATKKLNDWTNCVNAANVTVAFKRATGIVSGTFDLWYEGINAKGATEQANKLYGKLKHEGILLLSRADEGFLAEEVFTTGYFLAPQTFTETQTSTDARGKTTTKSVTRKYTNSYRFDIRAKDLGEQTWTDYVP